MFASQEGLRRLMSQETIKPKNLGVTLRRFGSYFRPYTPVLLVVAALVILSTWAQVITPELTGQAVDCYLAPLVSSTFAEVSGVSAQPGQQSTCWIYQDEAPGGLTRQVMRRVIAPGPLELTALTNAARLAGLGRLMVVMLVLKIVELTTTEELLHAPLHPYTEALLSAIPPADPDIRHGRIQLQGEVPSPANPPSGCRFHGIRAAIDGIFRHRLRDPVRPPATGRVPV